MKYGKLRIAWSVAWGVACLLLVALWVRSYWWWDYAVVAISSQGSGMSLESVQGHLFVWYSAAGQISRIVSIKLGSGNVLPGLELQSFLFFVYKHNPSETFVGIPHWLGLLCTGFTAVAPWIQWKRRFSLRTLLIGMTVAAVLLGWAVYAITQ